MVTFKSPFILFVSSSVRSFEVTTQSKRRSARARSMPGRLRDQRGERLELEEADGTAAGAGSAGTTRRGVDLAQREGAAGGGEAAGEGTGLGVEAGVGEADDRGAGLDAAEPRGEVAVPCAQAGGAAPKLLHVPLLAGAGPARRLAVRDPAPEPTLRQLVVVGGDCCGQRWRRRRRVLLRRRGCGGG